MSDPSHQPIEVRELVSGESRFENHRLEGLSSKEKDHTLHEDAMDEPYTARGNVGVRGRHAK